MLKKTILDTNSPKSFILLRDLLYNEVHASLKQYHSLVVLCIGTDRSTGDSLGPLVGYKLKPLIRNRIPLYGTLDSPVHAKNISHVITEIHKNHLNPFIIAVDASLGDLKNIGKVVVDKNPLKPGSAMNKDLPLVGNVSITGIVNISSPMDFVMLQNTRLYTVMTLADAITQGIYHCILKTFGTKSIS